MGEHELKTWVAYFDAILSGQKRFEIRKNDRGFRVGDVLHLREWGHDFGYTGRELRVSVDYMVQGILGLPPDICVMSIAPPRED